MSSESTRSHRSSTWRRLRRCSVLLHVSIPALTAETPLFPLQRWDTAEVELSNGKRGEKFSLKRLNQAGSVYRGDSIIEGSSADLLVKIAEPLLRNRPYASGNESGSASIWLPFVDAPKSFITRARLAFGVFPVASEDSSVNRIRVERYAASGRHMRGHFDSLTLNELHSNIDLSQRSNLGAAPERSYPYAGRYATMLFFLNTPDAGGSQLCFPFIRGLLHKAPPAGIDRGHVRASVLAASPSHLALGMLCSSTTTPETARVCWGRWIEHLSTFIVQRRVVRCWWPASGFRFHPR